MLSADFIYDTYTRALEASTKRDTIPHLPTIGDYLVLPIKEEPRFLSESSSSDNDAEGDDGRPKKRRRISENKLPDLEMWDEDIELEDVPRLCIERPSPLICVNQDLVCRLLMHSVDTKLLEPGTDTEYRSRPSSRYMNPAYSKRGDR